MRLLFVLGFAQFILACGVDTAASGNSNGNGSGGGGSSAASGLPCDVQDVLTNRCQGCHGNPPSGGAPMSLVTYEDLVAKNTAGVSAVQRCIDRMKGVGAQMPPAPAIAPPVADIATLQAWVNAGEPSSNCTQQPNPFDGPPRCTSGVVWSSGGDGTGEMEPGVACIHCHHDSIEAPQFTVAGTVYPTGHEPNECFGVSGGATIEVTTANGTVVNIPVNGAGNFYALTPIAFPIHVAVVVGGTRRSMAGAPTSGDCNTCHTQNGANMAPGRVVLP